MAPGEMQALSGRLDGIANAVGELRGTLAAMMAQWGQQESHASAGRAIVHQKVDALTREVGNLIINLQHVTQDVAELKNDIETRIEPSIDAYNIGVAHRQGVAWAGKLFWAIIVGIASALGFAAHELFLYYGHSASGVVTRIH